MIRNTAFLHAGISLNAVSRDGTATVYFQHGLCGSAAQTAEVFPDDPRFGLRTVECRGHGGSATGDVKAFSIKTFASDVAAFIEAGRTTPVVVGGISMGAAIALHLAVHRPALVKALIIARPAWVSDASPENMQPNLEVGELLRDYPAHIAKEKFLSGAIAKKLSQHAPDNLASLTSFFSREPLDVTSALLCAISKDGPSVTQSEVKVIAVPTLILATGHDIIHPLSHAHALQKMIPKSQLAVITAKSVDKQRYVAEFRSELLRFLEVHA